MCNVMVARHDRRPARLETETSDGHTLHHSFVHTLSLLFLVCLCLSIRSLRTTWFLREKLFGQNSTPARNSRISSATSSTWVSSKK